MSFNQGRQPWWNSLYKVTTGGAALLLINVAHHFDIQELEIEVHTRNNK